MWQQETTTLRISEDLSEERSETFAGKKFSGVWAVKEQSACLF